MGLFVAGSLALSTERVVVFKDGHGLFTKVATATADADGRVFTDRVPEAAVLGTFWALSDEGKILGMRAEWDERKEIREETVAAITTRDVLEASIGKQVTLTVVNGEDRETVAGTVVEVLARALDPDREIAAVAIPPRPDAPPGFRESFKELTKAGGDLLVLDGEHGRTVLPISAIRTVTGRDLGTRVTRRREVTTRSKRLSFDLGKEAANKPVKLRLFYFTPGVRWIPTYRVGGTLDDKADLALQAEVLNEEEDIVNAALDLVVGVPSFRFKGTVSPLSLESVLRNALAEAAPNLMGQMMGNALSNASFRSRAGELDSGYDEQSHEGSATELPAELTASGEHDHFVYSVKSFSLKKGGRASLPLWQSTVPLRHLYTMDVDVVRNGEQTRYASLSSKLYSAPGAASPLTLSQNPVWHQLELANPAASGTPWTTGAAFMTANGIPLGQDILVYTAPGAKALVPMTVAIDVRGDVEEEIERRPNALKWNGDQYTLVRKKGKTTLKNHDREAKTVRVKIGAGGKAETATDAGRIRLDEWRQSDWQGGYQPPGLNPHSEITWEITLKPGESKTLTWTAAYYTR